MTSGSDSAFPQIRNEAWDSRDICEQHLEGGLTKRELFAAMAMIANRQAYPVESSGQVARNSISDADALLAELAKERKP